MHGLKPTNIQQTQPHTEGNPTHIAARIHIEAKKQPLPEAKLARMAEKISCARQRLKLIVRRERKKSTPEQTNPHRNEEPQRGKKQPLPEASSREWQRKNSRARKRLKLIARPERKERLGSQREAPTRERYSGYSSVQVDRDKLYF